jgi:hypothetical protein
MASHRDKYFCQLLACFMQRSVAALELSYVLLILCSKHGRNIISILSDQPLYGDATAVRTTDRCCKATADKQYRAPLVLTCIV